MKDLLNRAFHTFWQTALTFFIIGLYDVFNTFQSNVNAGKAALVALLAGAVAAGLSAVKTFVVQTK